MKAQTLLIFVLIVVIAVLYLRQPHSGHEQQLRRIQAEKDSLAILLKISARKQQRYSIIYRVKADSINLMRRLNKASATRLYRKQQELKSNEKKLAEVLFYSDAAMDSLYRARYPKADSTIR